MPICKKCTTGFDFGDTDICPKCGTAYESPMVSHASSSGSNISIIVRYSLYISILAALFGAAMCGFQGVASLVSGDYWNACLAIFIGLPLCIGQFIVFNFVRERYGK